MDLLTITIPIKEKKEILVKFIEHHRELFKKYPIRIIATSDTILFVNNVEISDMKFWEARRKMIDLTSTKYILVLDSDTLLPYGYVDEALQILEKNDKVGVVALDYETLQGHLAFGTSIWRTDLLKKYYDWNPSGICECLYMWSKIRHFGYQIETLPMRAKHLKDQRE
jgi:cellulose synthase/poly-beta-1,6-N-acetylglucosamine synthase-like glycosyltransferase